MPTYDDEVDDAQQGTDIEGAWAGGKDGMQVTNVLLDQVKVSGSLHPRPSMNDCALQYLLSPTGRFYLVAVAQNDIPAIQRRMLEKYSLHSEVWAERLVFCIAHLHNLIGGPPAPGRGRASLRDTLHLITSRVTTYIANPFKYVQHRFVCYHYTPHIRLGSYPRESTPP